MSKGLEKELTIWTYVYSNAVDESAWTEETIRCASEAVFERDDPDPNCQNVTWSE